MSKRTLRTDAEKFDQAAVSQVLDKIRFLSLTDKKVLGEGDNTKLEIQMQTCGDLNLIGQFGVRFYSVYLVADYVEVINKHNDDKQYVVVYIWESKADRAFAVSEDIWNEPLDRGTDIRLHLRDEAGEYLDEYKLMVCATYIYQGDYIHIS
ncbi:hypothetical protein RND71_035329 [Anisodus tanguticus]|uniref:Uncharacterized protein n=1 Tax=Anisodus tanguticus TaxID=243964 RepID=A0AAE1R5E3_9SOLA|nr:hypothetical protein RND71_035329 [Anisodus tanguticus]